MHLSIRATQLVQHVALLLHALLQRRLAFLQSCDLPPLLPHRIPVRHSQRLKLRPLCAQRVAFSVGARPRGVAVLLRLLQERTLFGARLRGCQCVALRILLGI